MSEVLVGVDGSAQSEQALQVALQEAAVRGADLRVLRVCHTAAYVGAVPGLVYDPAPLVLDGGLDAAREVVDDSIVAARRATGIDTVRVVTDVRGGDPAAELAAASREADLLVLGSRRHGPLAAALVGSATNYVLHHADSPVLITPATGTAPRPWQRVVVGVDGSLGAEAALRWGATQARLHGCPLLALHAWQLVANPDWLGHPVVPAEDDRAEHAMCWLDEQVLRVLPERRGLVVEVRTVQDFASSALLAATGQDDLLVVGSRGRSSLVDLLIGSVAMQCAHHARSAVAVVRPTSYPRA